MYVYVLAHKNLFTNVNVSFMWQFTDINPLFDASEPVVIPTVSSLTIKPHIFNVNSYYIPPKKKKQEQKTFRSNWS